MRKLIAAVICCIVFLLHSTVSAEMKNNQPVNEALVGQAQREVDSATEMLSSLLDLQKNLKDQIKMSQRKLKASNSDAEKQTLENEIAELDKQLSETSHDFERIATGVEPALFVEKQPETFSWKEEVASLLEPAIKELKRFTIRARQKSDVKEKISELKLLVENARQAVVHLEAVSKDAEDKRVQKEVEGLLPEWRNVEDRLGNKLELAQRELTQLQAQELSLVETSSRSLRDFFRARGLYLLVALSAFVSILVGCRLFYRLVALLYLKLGKQKTRSFRLRLLYIVFQVLSVVLAIIGLFFVLYLAEDWFLLSMAIVFFLGLAWTIRQALPRFWQQARLMLNVGAVREKERLVLHGVPWRVESINVFCKLVNPALEITLRLPIEEMTGLASRPYNHDESWFPCRKGDWVVVNGNSRAKVVSLSHEQVEVVERGGRRITYPTGVFLGYSPANLSRNFRLRVPFGLSYGLQEQATNEIPEILREYISCKMKDNGYEGKCLNLNVEFLQANASSLDLLVLADMSGDVADVCKRIERAIQKWCVDCCTENGWEIPFPQLTIHKAK